MTNQELFDACLNHLRKQGKRAINKMGDCMYRAPDGSMCAVGALIPDDKYTQDLENCSVAHRAVAEAAGIHDDQIGLAHSIQRWMHDMNYAPFLENLELRAKDVAADYGLEYTK